jgi:hypothetical protein
MRRPLHAAHRSLRALLPLTLLGCVTQIGCSSDASPDNQVKEPPAAIDFGSLGSLSTSAGNDSFRFGASSAVGRAQREGVDVRRYPEPEL